MAAAEQSTIERAGKYSPVPGGGIRMAAGARVLEQARPGSPGPGRSPGPPSGAAHPNKAGLPAVARGYAVPILKRRLTNEEAVDQVSDQVDQARADGLRARGFNFYIPRFRRSLSLGDWRWQELREGGMLKRYLEREKHTTTDRWRAVGRARQGFQQNPRSDIRLKASIPKRDFIRFKTMDRHFWEDDANLRSLRRDNPDITSIYV